MNLDSKSGVRAAQLLAVLVILGGLYVAVEVVRHLL
jgi:hypothetical protein